MKLVFVSTDDTKLEELLKPFEKHFSRATDAPDYVIALGGDGTLMRAEFQFPGVPKLLLRNSKKANLAHPHENERVLKEFFAENFTVREETKLLVHTGSRSAEALNDIVVHNADPRFAIRYSIVLDGKHIHDEVIGDGIVCATPLGSTGYYRSITDSTFGTGIGVAFNNSTEQTDHMVIPESSVITTVITRGPAVCYADNQETFFELKDGDVITVQKSKNTAKIVSVKV
jgi:NAD kinase